VLLAIGYVGLFVIDYDYGEESDKLQVVTSFYPLYYFASEIGGDRAEISSLIPNNMEPHSWNPKPSDLIGTSRSDVFVYNGGGFEPWADGFIAQLENDVEVVDTSEGIEVGTNDPHFWLDPLTAKVQVDNIANAFYRADPGNATYYQANAADLQSRLDQLDQDYQMGLEGRTKNDIVTTHEGFNYLAMRYGFEAHAAIGISGDEQPSVQDMARLTDLILGLGLHYVFSEPTFNDAVMQQISDQTGAEVLVLDGVHSQSGVNSDKDYFEMMYANLEALRIGMEVRTDG
jgi:zinc transport system substrate-binding protein